MQTIENANFKETLPIQYTINREKGCFVHEFLTYDFK